ncbi:hypothetical protein ACHQM5_011117 [Ranunculus cassubicifolius]
METEVITPEAEVVENMEEAKEMTGGQPGTVLSKASLGESQEVEDGHSKHAGVVENSRGTEELVATQNLNNGVKKHDNEGQECNSESDSFLESPPLAEKHSDESLRASQEIEDKDTPVLMHTEGLENGSQIQKDQTGKIVEVTGDVTEGNRTDVNGKETEMRIDDARDVPKEQKDDVNVRENLHTVPTTSSSGDLNQQEGKAEDGSEAVVDNIEQESDALFDDKPSPVVGNSVEVMAGEKEEDEAVSSSQLDLTEGKNSGEESNLNSNEQNLVNNVEANAYEKEGIADNSFESPVPVNEEEKQPPLQEEERESKEKSTILDSTAEGHEKIYPTEHVLKSLPEKTGFDHDQIGEAENNFPITEDTESQYSKVEPRNTSVAPIDSQEERGAENAIEPETQDKNINKLIEKDDIDEEKIPEQSKVDKEELEQKDIQELAPVEMHKDLDYSSAEQVQKGAEIVESHDEGQSDIKEEDCSVKDLTAVSNGEQGDNDSVKENDVAENPKEEEVNEELLVVPDEHNEKQDKEEGIKIQEPSTEASEDKNEVIEELENAGPEKETAEPIIEEDLVPEYSKTRIEKEEAEDGLEKEKETRESAIDSSEKDIKEPTVEEDILNNPTEIIEEEPLEDDRDENKVTGGSQVVGAEDTRENILEEGVLPVVEKSFEDRHDEEKEIEELETMSANQDIKEPIVEEVVSNHSTNNIADEQVINEHEESEVTGESELLGKEYTTGDTTMEKGDGLYPSETEIKEEPIIEGHSEEKKIEELEIAGIDNNTEELISEEVRPNHSASISPVASVMESYEENVKDNGETINVEDIAQDTSKTNTEDEQIKENHNEDKAINESEIPAADKEIREPSIGSHVAEDNYTTTIEDSQEESMETEGSKSLENVEETIVLNDIVPDHSETSIKEEAIKDGIKDEKEIEEIEIVAVDKSISEPITEEVVPDHSTTIPNDESVEDSQEEKVSVGSELARTDKDIQDTVKEEDVTVDEQASQNGDKLTEDQEISVEDKSVEPIRTEVVSDSFTMVNEDGHEESKVSGGSQVASDEVVEETSIEKDNVPTYSETTVEDEPLKDVDDGVKASEETDIVGEGKSIGEPITEEIAQNHSTYISGDEPAEDSHEEKETEEIEIAAVDKSISEPITEEVVPDHSTIIPNDESVEDSQEEKVSGGSELARTDEDIQDTVKEEDVVPDYSETTTVDEQASQNGDKLNEDQEISVEDKSIVEPTTKEVVSDSFTMVNEDGHEESKVSGGSQVASDEAVEDASVKEDIVPAYSEITAKDDPIKYVDDEVKASEETDIVGEEKSIGEPITEEVAQNHSTYISGDEPAKESHEEKVSGGLEIVVADKDIEDNVKEEDVFPDHIETPITEEQIEEVHNEEKVTGEPEIASVSKDIKKPLIEEAAFPDYTTAITEDDAEESKVTGESQTPGIEDMREAIIEKDISPEDSEATTWEEPIIDGHDKDKLNGEPETASADENTRSPILEEVGLDHSGTIIDNDLNKDNIEETKVAEESKIVGEDKNIGEVPCHSETTVGENINKEHNEKEKDIEEIEKDSADKDITEPITEEATVPTCSTTITEDETIEPEPLIQVIQEREIQDASITGVPAVSGSDKTTKEDSQEDAIDTSKHEVETKESDLTMEPAAEEQESTEKVNRVDMVEEENEHKNHDVDNVIETKEEEKVPKDISEDHSDTANELNYEAADKTEEIEKVHSKDSKDLHEIQETDENKETTEEEEKHNESSEMLGETSSLAPFVSEEQTNKEIIEEEKSRNTETVESNDSNITQQLLEDSEISDAKQEEKVHGEDGGFPKEEVPNVEFREMNQEPEIPTSQTQEEKTIDEETSLTHKGETASIKLEETDETDSTELTEQKNIELEPKEEGQDEMYPSVVEHGTITSAEKEEVCAEPTAADITENSESAKERRPILEDVTSGHGGEETIDVSHEEEKEDSSNPSGEIPEILEVSGASKEIEELSIEEKEEEHETVQGAIDDKSIEEQTPRELPVESGTDSFEGQLIKESSQQAEVYEELDSVAAKEDPENLTTDTEQTKVGSQEDDGIETPGDEKQAKDSDSVSTMMATDSTKEREILPLEEEKDPKKSHDAFIASETPLKENTSTERSTEIDTSPKSLVSEEQDIDEVPEKTMSTSNNHESDSSTSLTGKLSSHDTELEPEVEELVDDSDISSKFSTAIEGNSASSRDSTVEDVERKEDNTTDNVLVAETLVADEVENKQSEIPEETSDDISEEPQETSTLVSDRHESDETEMKEKIQDKSIIEDETKDKIEAPLVSERDGSSFSLEQNATLAQNAEAIDPCKEFPKDTESADQDQCHEVLPATEKTTFMKDEEIINEQDAVSAEDPTVDESIQEKIKENKNLEEEDTYLDAEDEKLEAMSFEKPSELASQIPSFNNENIDQESGLVEKNVKLERYLSAGDRKLDELMYPEKSSDLVSQIPTLNNEKINQDTAVVEKNVEDIIESDMPVKNKEESSEKNVEDIIKSDIPVKNTEESSEKNVEDIIESDIPLKSTEESSEKNLEDIIESDIPVKNTKESSEKNVDDIIQSDIPVKNIEESSEKKVEDIIDSDIPVQNTEESSENDQMNVEASTPRELIEPTELVYQEKTNDNIPIVPSLGEETSIGYVGDAGAEEIRQEGKEEDVIKKAICELKDDETNKSNEGTLADEDPKYLENASHIQNNERQSLGETEAPKDSVQELSSDNAYLASLKESEEKTDNVDEEEAMLVNEEHVTVSNAEKSNGDDTYEAKAPEDGIFDQEVPEGSEDTFAGHKIGEQMIEGVKDEPDLVADSRESIQLTRQGEDVESAGTEELSTTSEPEKIYSEKESPTDDNSNANETSKNEVAHEMFTSQEAVFVDEEILNQEDFAGRPVTDIVKSDQNVPSEETPIQVSKHLEEEFVYAPEELTHETLSKATDEEARIPSDTESFNDVEKPADSVSVTMPISAVEISPSEEEIPTDNASVSSLTEAPREQIQEKEGNCAEDEEKQEMAYTKKGTNEESGEETELEIPQVETSEGVKTNELNIQEKSPANEKGEPQLSILPDTSDAPAPKQISLEAEQIQKTEEKSSDSSTDVSSFSKDAIEKSLQADEIDDAKHGEDLGHESQVNDAKHNTDKEMNSSDETNTNVKSSEDGVSLSDMMDKSGNGSLQTVGQSEEVNPPHYKRLESNKALSIDIKDAEKTDQKAKDEEGEEDEDEDDDEHKKDDSGSDAPVMVEASKDIDMKTTPKKSHGILHGVGSKVKHSISKVKKAITGKSSPHKQSSPKS